jgi:hypothetical protein
VLLADDLVQGAWAHLDRERCHPLGCFALTGVEERVAGHAGNPSAACGRHRRLETGRRHDQTVTEPLDPEAALARAGRGAALSHETAAALVGIELLEPARERLGWRVLRFTWEDVNTRPAYVVALVRECLAPAA